MIAALLAWAPLEWALLAGLGSLALGALALAAELLLGLRGRALVAGLWWAALARLVLPPTVASPVGVSLATSASAGTPQWLVTTWGLVAAWAAGALVTAALALRQVARERRAWRSEPARAPRPSTRRAAASAARALGMARAPRIAVVASESAACVGVLTPWVAIPAELERAARRRDLEIVLAHEFAHARRRDGLRRAAVLVLRTAFWFHPVPWLAGQRLARLAEIECDRWAARVARGGPADCRRTILGLFAAQSGIQSALASTFGAPRSLVLTRLRALENDDPVHRAFAPIAFVLALACIGPLARRATIPPFDELEGCLQKRYAVLAAYAASQNAAQAAQPPSEP